jgi:hypothetical protein
VRCSDSEDYGLYQVLVFGADGPVVVKAGYVHRGTNLSTYHAYLPRYVVVPTVDGPADFVDAGITSWLCLAPRLVMGGTPLGHKL